MSADPSESQILENVFLAGDYLFNGSLNAAMESGRLAAEGIIEKKVNSFLLLILFHLLSDTEFRKNII